MTGCSLHAMHTNEITVNKNKLMYQLRTENKIFFISFDKYDYGGDLPATDKVLSLKSFPYKMTKQTDGSYFLASSGQRSKSLLFFPSLTSRTSRRFTEKKKKILLKDHVFILVSSFCTLQVLLNIEIVRLFFPQDICLALNIIFFGGGGQGLGQNVDRHIFGWTVLSYKWE